MRDIKFPIAGVSYPDDDRAASAKAAGDWIGKPVGQALRETAARYPARLAFISDERNVSFAQLDDLTERLGAALIERGLNPGDRAIFQLGTSIETAIVLYACFKAGIVPVCSLPQHRDVEISQLAEQSDAKAYFIQLDFSHYDLVALAERMMERVGSLRHLVTVRGKPDADDRRFATMDALIAGMPIERARAMLAGTVGAEDVLSFQLSGGTTGLPKIIPRFHAEYLGHSAAWMRRYRIDASSRVIWSLPLVHNAGQLYALIPVALHGLTVVVMPKVDIARMLELIGEHRVTHALSIGPIAPQLMAYTEIDRHDLSSLQLFSTMSRADKLEEHLKVPCSNLYGITEGLLLGSPADASAHARHHTQGASGCANDEIRLLDPASETPVAPGQMGEMCFRGPSSLTGFYNAPDANAKAFTSDGFYRTGDMMTAHEIDGLVCYAFEGRLRDNINRGGEKIGCEEVEAYVSQHPAIADAKLVAMADAFYGEKGCVYVVVRPGMQAPDVKALAAFLTGQGLAKYKCPERVEVVDAFPLTRVGKLDKPALKQMLVEQMAREQEHAGQATAEQAK